MAKSEVTLSAVVSLDDESKQLLADIRDRLGDVKTTQGPVEQVHRSARKTALLMVLAELDGWIQAARDNHFAAEHRSEIVGYECWRTMHVKDFRQMVRDAGQRLGADIRLTSYPVEDKV